MSNVNAIIVDNDEADVELFNILLQDFNINLDLTYFISIEDTLDYLNTTESKVDLIFTDLCLPSKDMGLAFISALRAHTMPKEAKIVVVSGATNMPTIKETILDGADYFIEKPFTISKFFDLIKKSTKFRLVLEHK